jgi:hypothetical protein
VATDDQGNMIRVTVDEIGPDQDNRLLATLVTDREELLVVPLTLLPEGTRTGDVLTLSFTPEPDERERRRKHISDLQRRLFGSG